MKLLLCSDFSDVGYRWTKKFFKDTKGLNVLFVGYAKEDDSQDDTQSGSYERFVEMGMTVDVLDKNYKFDKDIDIIFVRGGNTTKLIHYLKKYDQFDKIKTVAEKGALYIGNSAGAILAGSETEYTLDSEPYAVDLKQEFNDKNALKGYGWVDKMLLVHCSKYRMAWDFEKDYPEEVFRTLDRECYPAYLVDKKRFDKSTYIKIGNNQAYYVNGKDSKILTYNWSKIPVKTPTIYLNVEN